MDVLIIGSGGREHALAAALAADARVHCAPGNPGIADVAQVHPVSADDPRAVADLAERLGADLVVIGPEAPLVAGVADAVRDRGIACFGPSRDAARLEGSKAFAKDVMTAAGVPTARAAHCRTAAETAAALDEFGAPYVVKDDGLAAGKGVVVTDDREAALAHAATCGEVVVEEYLDGREFSLFVVCDGQRGVPLAPAQDFKRVGEGDTGPNTGGMGAFSPLPWLPADAVERVMTEVVAPVLAEMRRRETPFVGLLYVGLMQTAAGPQVVEFNVRFGDPETQVVLPRLESSLSALLLAAAEGHLGDVAEPRWSDDAVVGVVLAARGYPAAPERGGAVRIPAGVEARHAGTAAAPDGEPGLVAAGGRVLTVLGRGATIAMARAAAYAAVDTIDFPDGFCRCDIAADM